MIGTILVPSAERPLGPSLIQENFQGPHACDRSQHDFCKLGLKRNLHVRNLSTRLVEVKNKWFNLDAKTNREKEVPLIFGNMTSQCTSVWSQFCNIASWSTPWNLFGEVNSPSGSELGQSHHCIGTDEPEEHAVYKCHWAIGVGLANAKP